MTTMRTQAQEGLLEMIVLIALAACFKPNERYLLLDQIMVRDFAPNEYYGKKWVAKLIDRKLIDFNLVAPLSGAQNASPLIKRPAEAGECVDAYILKVSKRINRLLALDFNHFLYLKEFTLDILANECAEYARYYAHRSGLSIIQTSPESTKLKLLLLECDQEQVFMLLWRAVKQAQRNCLSIERHIHLDELIDTAFSFYIQYRRLGITIECYERPKQMMTSKLSEYASYFNSRFHESCD